MPDQPAALANRLGGCPSPYLRAHAAQPVAWQPWSVEVLALARRLDRPILLSSGYAACHWCHVMARESFSDPEIAARINAAFIPVKLDREEHPDIDHYYMTALQVMGVPGGWPMTVFLDTEGRPFAGGTYFPPRPAGGLPGFAQVLEQIAQAWTARRPLVAETAARIAAATAAALTRPPRHAQPFPEDREVRVFQQAGERLLALVDPMHGGFGGAPKFPQVPALRLLWRLRHDPQVGARAAGAVRAALAAMTAGGLHDQVGGGFHRYTVDAAWRVPHFEKMLSDNAELLLLMAEVARTDPAPWLADTAAGLVSWLLRDMQLAEGGFAASLDAESAGREGAAYLWTREELKEILGEDFQTFADAFFLDAQPALDGAIVLARRSRPDRAPRAVDAQGRLRPLLDRLAARRARRPAPRRDDKLVASWNGRLITALAAAGAAFARPDWIALGCETFKAVFPRLKQPGGGLSRHNFHGAHGPPAVLEDYAALAEAALFLHGATFEPKWQSIASDLAESAHERFFDARTGLYRLGPGAGLPQAPLLPDDGPSPSGTAILLAVFSRLARLDPAGTWRRRAEDLAAALGPILAERHPMAVAGCLSALGEHRRFLHITLTGPHPSQDPQAAALHRSALAAQAAGAVVTREAGPAPLRAVLCEGTRCLAPVATAERLQALAEEIGV